MRCSICIEGKGGQGIIKVGECLAEAAILEGMNVVQTLRYTPEVRGGNSSTDIIISDKEIYYPIIEKIDILLALSENGYVNNLSRILDKTLLIYDSDIISLPSDLPNTMIGIPFEEVSKEELGRPIFSNMIGLGVLIQITNVVHPESVLSIIKKRISHLIEENIKAFLRGLELGREINEKGI